MKKQMVIWAVAALVLAGCGDAKYPTLSTDSPVKVLEMDPVKRGAITMDVIYASEDTFMHQGMPAIDVVVQKLQSTLAMWPEAGNGEGVDACRMALRLHTTRMINVMDRLGTPRSDADRSSEFRHACRAAIGYKYDQARSHQVWDKLTALTH